MYSELLSFPVSPLCIFVVVVLKAYSSNLGIDPIRIILPVLVLNFNLFLSTLWEDPYHVTIPFYFVINFKIPE